MASNVVFDAIRSFLTEHWTTTPIAWENETPPATVDAQGAAIAWVLVEMTGTLYGQMSIGASLQADNRWDEEGQLWLHVFVPKGTGGSLVRQHAKALADLFRGTRLVNDSIEFRDASIGMGEPGDEQGKWFRVSCNIEWRRMEA